MFDPNKIEDLQYSTEKQIMDRKSARIRAVDLAIPIVAMANADGGYLAIGIEDDGTITGIDAHEKNVNELLRAPFDYCIPSVQVEPKTIDVMDCNGNANHVLRMQVFPSNKVVANQADDVYLRVGDKSKKLNFEQRLQLVYAKGVKFFEDQPVASATINDLDLDYVSDYCKKIGYDKGDAEFYLRHNHDFITMNGNEEVVSGAAILLFGKNPQRFFPRARVRFVRYEGKTAEVGDRMNVVKDVKFSGRILEQVKEATAFVKTQIREYTKLGEGAVFQTTPEFPEFCWTELIVNAVAHRDYSIGGTDIQIKMFDDHFTVESPGILPGLVRLRFGDRFGHQGRGSPAPYDDTVPQLSRTIQGKRHYGYSRHTGIQPLQRLVFRGTGLLRARTGQAARNVPREIPVPYGIWCRRRFQIAQFRSGMLRLHLRLCPQVPQGLYSGNS